MRRAPALAGWLLLSCGLLAGDVTLTTQVTSSRAGESGTQVMHLSAERAHGRMPGGSEVFLDYKQGTITVLQPDPKRKGKFSGMQVSYAQLEQMNQMLNTVAGRPYKKAQKESFGNDPKLNVESVGKETLLGRVCNKYRATLGTHTYEVSMDPSLDNTTYKAFEQATAAFHQSFQGTGTDFGQGLVQMMKTLKGVPLRCKETISINHSEYAWVATALSTDPLPASTWKLPDGVKVETMPSMGDMLDMEGAPKKGRKQGD